MFFLPGRKRRVCRAFTRVPEAGNSDAARELEAVTEIAVAMKKQAFTSRKVPRLQGFDKTSQTAVETSFYQLILNPSHPKKMAQISRATRFPLALPLRYRESGTIPWHKGSTVNISRTGILFQPERDLPLHTALEMRIEILPFSKMTLTCRGPVVRKQTPASSEDRPVLAAMIHACRLMAKRPEKSLT